MAVRASVLSDAISCQTGPHAQHGCSGPKWHRNCTLRKRAVGPPRYSSSRPNISRIASYVEGSSSDGVCSYMLIQCSY